MKTRRKEHPPLTTASRVTVLAHHPLLEMLNKAELTVLLRLLAATTAQSSKKVRVYNAQLYEKNPRSAAGALRVLEEMGLVKITFGERDGERLIEVR